MIPFDNPFAELSKAVGKLNPALVNKLETVEDVKPSAGTAHELNKRNSYARFACVGFRGTVDASFDRIDLNKFMGDPKKQDMSLRSRSKPATSHQAINLMNRKWQLGLKVVDIKLLPVSYDVEGVGLVTIEAVPECLSAFGKFSFYVIPGPDNISDLPLQRDLGFGLYPSGQMTKGQAQLLSYPADTTAHNAYLSALFVNKPIDEEMVTVVSELTGVQWSLNPGDYSLSGATVTYVGEVRNGWDVIKPNFSRIAIIKLGNACSNFAGELVFYHNPN